jgi:hypothetical protein
MGWWPFPVFSRTSLSKVFSAAARGTLTALFPWLSVLPRRPHSTFTV